MKKLFIASSVIFGVVLIFWGIYNFAFKTPASAPTEVAKKEEERLVPLQAEDQTDPTVAAKIKDISGEGVLGPVFKEENGKVFFYSALDGRVFSVNPDGSSKNVFSTQPLPGITNALWSPDQKRVISEFEGGARRYSYNYETKTGQVLKGGINTPTWSNLGDRIFYQYKNGKINELDYADPDGNNWKKITDIRADQVKVATIPQTSLVTFWNTPKSSEETSLLSVGILGGEVKKIFGGKFGADYLWSPNGKSGLVSFLDKQNGSRTSLGVMDYDGANFRDLSIPTSVSKCAWSKDGQFVFYALPGGAVEKADTFWKVNLATGEKIRLIELEDLAKLGQGLDAEKLFLSANEKNLFFVNRTDGHLFRLSLAEKN
jgi:Tol biopolymer transport system component